MVVLFHQDIQTSVELQFQTENRTASVMQIALYSGARAVKRNYLRGGNVLKIQTMGTAPLLCKRTPFELVCF